MEKNEFLKDRLLVEKNDEIDNAVWHAVWQMSLDDPEWDMQIIGPIEEFIKATLEKHGIPTCWPWENENGTVCCLTDDACKHCPYKRGD